MLRITVHEDGTYCTLVLAGRLEGPWALETEYAWRSSLRSGHQFEIDMRQLIGVDAAARQLLSAMHLAGARLVVEGVWMKALVDEIAGKPAVEGTMGNSQKKKAATDQRSECRRDNK